MRLDDRLRVTPEPGAVRRPQAAAGSRMPERMSATAPVAPAGSSGRWRSPARRVRRCSCSRSRRGGRARRGGLGVAVDAAVGRRRAPPVGPGRGRACAATSPAPARTSWSPRSPGCSPASWSRCPARRHEVVTLVAAVRGLAAGRLADVPRRRRARAPRPGRSLAAARPTCTRLPGRPAGRPGPAPSWPCPRGALVGLIVVFLGLGAGSRESRTAGSRRAVASRDCSPGWLGPPRHAWGRTMSSSQPPGGSHGPEYLEQGGGAPLRPTASARRRGRGGRRAAVARRCGRRSGSPSSVAGPGRRRRSSAPAPSPREALPATTLGYVSVDLDPSGGQKIEAIRTLRKFPAFRDQIGLTPTTTCASKIFDEIEKQAHCQGLDYADDVEPWLGDRAAVAAVDTGADAAGAGLRRAGQATRTRPTTASATLRELRRATAATAAAGSIDGGWAVIAETDEIADSRWPPTPTRAPLSDDADFQHWTGEAGDPGIVSHVRRARGRRHLTLAEMGSLGQLDGQRSARDGERRPGAAGAGERAEGLPGRGRAPSASTTARSSSSWPPTPPRPARGAYGGDARRRRAGHAARRTPPPRSALGFSDGLVHATWSTRCRGASGGDTPRSCSELSRADRARPARRRRDARRRVRWPSGSAATSTPRRSSTPATARASRWPSRSRATPSIEGCSTRSAAGWAADRRRSTATATATWSWSAPTPTTASSARGRRPRVVRGLHASGAAGRRLQRGALRELRRRRHWLAKLASGDQQVERQPRAAPGPRHQRLAGRRHRPRPAPPHHELTGHLQALSDVDRAVGGTLSACPDRAVGARLASRSARSALSARVPGRASECPECPVSAEGWCAAVTRTRSAGRAPGPGRAAGRDEDGGCVERAASTTVGWARFWPTGEMPPAT